MRAARSAVALSCVTAAAALVALSPRPAAAARTFHSDNNGYTLTLPDGWEPVPDPDIDVLRAVMRKAPNDAGPRLEVAFHPAGTASHGYPRAVVQVARYPEDRQPSPAQIAAMAAALSRVDVKKLADDQ